ncbi:cytochrome P450 27C1 isoform X4 [Mycteria americana]|uniref:cytochrome P450 27C1 isoform X4 n=1 Tax=Mycteria americana TaxID=33587 RepID=UPI003F58B33A
MSFFTRVLTMKCKQALESERTYFYHAIFVSRFHQLPKLSSSQSLEVQNNSPAAAENKGEEMVADSGRAGELLKPTPHQLGRVKSLQEMPGPNTLYNLYEFFWKDGFGRIHEIQIERWLLKSSGQKAEHHKELTWNPGRNTETYEGEPWDLFLRVNEVITDLIKRIHTLRSQEDDGETVTNVNNLFFKYSMEGVATILYECRLGCLENNVPQQTVEYIEALELMFSMFKTTMYAGAIPKWLRPLIPKPWREFCRSWDGLFKFSQIHVDNKLKAIQSQLDQGEVVNGGLLTYLLVSKELTLEEIYANMTEMLLAGVDTTSFTLSWATYLLAKHPEVQQRVYEEIVNKLGKDQVPVAHDVPKLPLIRAVLKETLRLYPVLPGNGRVTQKDLIIGGYLIPKGTQLALCHYTTSYSEENFSMANEFRPERWLRKDNLDRVDNFGSIPFGYGIRSCIGKRIAELEIHLALIQLLQNFEIKISSKTEPVNAKTHGLLTPGNSINVRFSDRK